MLNQFEKMQILIGKNHMEKLKNSHVIVFGIGGVGGHIVEALVRSGIGSISIVDNDKISLTNLNRQILATHKNIGEYKIDVAEKRILDINPDCKTKKFKVFYLPETSSQIDLSQYNYIIDSIDTVSGKIEIIKNAKKFKIPIISCMGTGNKLNPLDLNVTDIYKTKVCPLAKVMRKLCKENNIDALKVIYSHESPLTPIVNSELKTQGLGSTAFVANTAGLIIASEVIKDIINKNI